MEGVCTHEGTHTRTHVKMRVSCGRCFRDRKAPQPVLTLSALLRPLCALALPSVLTDSPLPGGSESSGSCLLLSGCRGSPLTLSLLHGGTQGGGRVPRFQLCLLLKPSDVASAAPVGTGPVTVPVGSLACGAPNAQLPVLTLTQLEACSGLWAAGAKGHKRGLRTSEIYFLKVPEAISLK